MRFLTDYLILDSTYSRYSWLISCTNLNLASGKRFSSICSEFWDVLTGLLTYWTKGEYSFREQAQESIISWWNRFRDVPTFGRDSIRRFANSVSELKRLGARDYENILQVSQYFVIVCCHI